MNRIRAGFCHWSNPFSGQVYRVSLKPEDCTALVFWTRNPAPMLPHLDELEARGYTFYFHYTLIGYSRPLESHNPGMDAALHTFERLSDRLGPERVLWRYDPILISDLTPLDFHRERFALLVERLAGLTERCTYSFLDMYGKTERNLAKISVEPTALEGQDRFAFLRDLVSSAEPKGIHLYSCCEEDFQHVPGLRRGSCVDADLLARLLHAEPLDIKPQPTRLHCGCVKSVDIGSYESCLFGCAYCYATNSRSAAQRNYAAHDPTDSILIRPPRLRRAMLP